MIQLFCDNPLAEIAQLRKGIWRELYDLKKDPAEKTNIIENQPEVARQLERKLDSWIRSHGYTPHRSGLAVLRAR